MQYLLSIGGAALGRGDRINGAQDLKIDEIICQTNVRFGCEIKTERTTVTKTTLVCVHTTIFFVREMCFLLAREMLLACSCFCFLGFSAAQRHTNRGKRNLQTLARTSIL